MILDSGICGIYREMDVSDPGEMPEKEPVKIFESWYGLRGFETSPVWQTEGRQERQVDLKIRIMQCLDIRQNDVAIVAGKKYRIIRAYHGEDEDGPTRITDLSLEVIRP